jgi:hypothetical protein
MKIESYAILQIIKELHPVFQLLYINRERVIYPVLTRP